MKPAPFNSGGDDVQGSQRGLSLSASIPFSASDGEKVAEGKMRCYLENGERGRGVENTPNSSAAGKDIEFVAGLFGHKLVRAEPVHECFAAQLGDRKSTHGRRAQSKGVDKFGFRRSDFGFQFACCYVFAEAAGHTDGRVPGALEWLWQGYKCK